MKIFILTLFTIYLSFPGFSQELSYTTDHLGTIGDVYATAELQLDTAEWIPADSVDPQLWNFTSLQPNVNGTIEILSKDGFPELDTLPETTMVMKNQDNSYTCLNLEANVLYLLGMLIDMEGELFPVLLDPAPEYLTFPLTIGAGGSETINHEIEGTPEDFNLSIPFHDSVRFDIRITASRMVEDTGTVETWQYAYSAFKVSNATIFEVDLYGKPSIGGWYLMEDDVAVDSTKGLQFYTPEYGVPVVEIQMNWDNEIQGMRMIDENAQNITYPVQQNIAMYPNPVQSGNTLHFNRAVSGVSLFDMNGRLVLKSSTPDSKIKLPDLPSGIYILKSKNMPEAKKIIVQ